jgi:parvulin-like peptidyl-prolyl isomerase
VRTRADLLRAGEEVEGDSTLLPPGFENARRRAVDGTFGARFSGHLDAQDPGTWSDPIRSGLGYHLVYLEERTPGKLPGLEEIRNAVRREWENEYRVRLREQFNAKLLEKYDVRIEAGADKQEPGDEQRDG